MKEKFEDIFMEIQADLISLCLEVTENKVDRVYAYASIEEKSTMFNAFFEKEGKVLTLNQLGIDKVLMMEFLKIGTADLSKLKSICEKNETQVPTQIKMDYDVKSGKFKADYQYEEACTERTDMSSGELFMNWFHEIVNAGKMA